MPKPLAARTFRASRRFVLQAGGMALLCVVLAAGFGLAHQIRPVPLFGAVGLAFLLLYVTAATLRVTMDTEGLAQRWVWGRRRIAWEAVASIERTRRGQFLLDEKNKEIFAVSALPPEDQQRIVAEAVRRARLRRDRAAPRPPVVERWVRK